MGESHVMIAWQIALSDCGVVVGKCQGAPGLEGLTPTSDQCTLGLDAPWRRREPYSACYQEVRSGGDNYSGHMQGICKFGPKIVEVVL